MKLSDVEIKAIRPLVPVNYYSHDGFDNRVKRHIVVSKEWIGDWEKPRIAFNALKSNTTGIYEAVIYRDIEMDKPEYIKVELEKGYMNVHTVSGSSQEAVDAVIRFLNQ